MSQKIPREVLSSFTALTSLPTEKILKNKKYLLALSSLGIGWVMDNIHNNDIKNVIMLVLLAHPKESYSTIKLKKILNEKENIKISSGGLWQNIKFLENKGMVVTKIRPTENSRAKFVSASDLAQEISTLI